MYTNMEDIGDKLTLAVESEISELDGLLAMSGR